MIRVSVETLYVSSTESSRELVGWELSSFTSYVYKHFVFKCVFGCLFRANFIGQSSYVCVFRVH